MSGRSLQENRLLTLPDANVPLPKENRDGEHGRIVFVTSYLFNFSVASLTNKRPSSRDRLYAHLSNNFPPNLSSPNIFIIIIKYNGKCRRNTWQAANYLPVKISWKRVDAFTELDHGYPDRRCYLLTREPTRWKNIDHRSCERNARFESTGVARKREQFVVSIN